MISTKNTLFTCCLLFCVSIMAFAQNDRLPSTELDNIHGDRIDVSTFGENEKITVMSFWATWCAPCKKELNTLADFYPDWQDDFNVEIIAVSTDDARTAPSVKPYVEGKAWDYNVLLDVNQELQRALNFQTVPFTIVLDQKGNIVYRHSGYVPGDEYELEDIITKLSEGKSVKDHD